MHTDVRMLLATAKYHEGSVDSTRLDAHVTNMGVNSSVPGLALMFLLKKFALAALALE